MDNNVKNNDTVKIVNLVLGIIIFLMVIAGSTFAYFAFSASNNIIGGDAGNVNLTLTVTKVLPVTNTTDDILIANFCISSFENTYVELQKWQETSVSSSSANSSISFLFILNNALSILSLEQSQFQLTSISSTS